MLINLKPKVMTLQEYEELLKNHDWYYQYSDDHGVWDRGKTNFEYIIQQYQYNDLNAGKAGKEAYWKLFKQYYDKYFPDNQV